MSTRMSVYYVEDGIHVFHDLMHPEVDLWLEYSSAHFQVTMPLPEDLARAIRCGLARSNDAEVKE